MEFPVPIASIFKPVLCLTLTTPPTTSIPRPLMFYYEVTQACDLICKHCRASAQSDPDPDELTTEQSMALIDQVTTFPRPPIMVMTGGDPLKRAGLVRLDSLRDRTWAAGRADAVGHAAGHGGSIRGGARRGRQTSGHQPGRCRRQDARRVSRLGGQL